MALTIDERILGKQKRSALFYTKWISILLLVLTITSVLWYKYVSIETYTNVRISNTEVKDGRFLILTNHGAFKNVDSLMHFKTRSADIQGKVAPGDICDITVYGIRNGLFSIYPNVLSIKSKE